MNAPAIPELDFPRWAIVELLGHRRLGGWVSETEQFGAKLLRIDIPSSSEPEKIFATQLYSPKSLYGVTPCDETEARKVAAYAQPYFPSGPQLRERNDELDDDDDDRAEEFSDEQCERCSKRELETVCNDETSGWTYDSEDGWLCPDCTRELHGKGVAGPDPDPPEGREDCG